MTGKALALSLTCLCGVPAAPVAQPRQARFEARADLVPIQVSARRPDGRPLEGLQRGDLVVLDEGEARPVVVFETDVSARTVLVLDTSQSTLMYQKAMVEIVEWFAAQAHPGDCLALVTAADRVRPSSWFAPAAFRPKTAIGPWATTDGSRLLDAIEVGLGLLDSRSGCAGTDGTAAPGLVDRMFLVTDAQDVDSDTSVADLRTQIAQRDVQLNGVLLGPSHLLHTAFSNLAETSGGVIGNAVTHGRLWELERDLLSVWRSTYLIAFKPDAAPGGGPRRITVQAPAHPGAELRYRREYWR